MNTPPQIARLCIHYGVNKVERSILKTFALSIIGGFLIGSSSILSTICKYNYYGGLAQFYGGIVFPIGIMAVYCGGAEIFTGNTLLTIGFFNHNISALEMLLNWLVTFVGNFIGAILIAVLVVYSHITNMFNTNLAQVVITTGIEKCSLSFEEALLKGLLGNFYNCLGIWVSLGGKDLRSVIVGIWTPIFLLAACNLEDCVANMYYITAGIFASYEYDLDMVSISWGRLFYKNLIPVAIGNILGGGFLVGAVYWYIFLTVDETEIIQSAPKNLESLNINKNIILNKENNENNHLNMDNSQGMLQNGDLSTFNHINK